MFINKFSFSNTWERTVSYSRLHPGLHAIIKVLSNAIREDNIKMVLQKILGPGLD
jgi:hypothetical protein